VERYAEWLANQGQPDTYMGKFLHPLNCINCIAPANTNSWSLSDRLPAPVTLNLGKPRSWPPNDQTSDPDPRQAGAGLRAAPALSASGERRGASGLVVRGADESRCAHQVAATNAEVEALVQRTGVRVGRRGHHSRKQDSERALRARPAKRQEPRARCGVRMGTPYGIYSPHSEGLGWTLRLTLSNVAV
jgi:hypothetical protein